MRLLVGLLLLANALFFGWTQGGLDGVAGVRAHGDREPERLAQQVRPEVVRALTPAAAAALAAQAASAAAAPAAPSGPAAASSAPSAAATSAVSAPLLACLEAGPFTAAELGAAQAALRGTLPQARFSDISLPRGGAWMVYMGRYDNRDLQLRKEEELRRIRVAFEALSGPQGPGPGLSLGRFDSRAGADAALGQFARRGIRTARVVEVVPPVVTHLLRFERADAALAGRPAGRAGQRRARPRLRALPARGLTSECLSSSTRLTSLSWFDALTSRGTVTDRLPPDDGARQPCRPDNRPMTSLIDKLCPRAELAERIAALPRPVVFTNGVFDLLHRGHVIYLEQARRLGASLLVALNSDASARQLGKGPERPLNAEADRACVLAALQSVSLVTLFDERTPVELLMLARPDLYVKGGDYDIESLAETRVVRSWGGDARALGFVDGYSTTALVGRIRG